MVKYSLIIAALLGCTLSVNAIRVQSGLEDQMFVQVSSIKGGDDADPADSDPIKKEQAAPGKSSSETPLEAGESKDDAKTNKQNELISKIQASGDNDS